MFILLPTKYHWCDPGGLTPNPSSSSTLKRQGISVGCRQGQKTTSQQNTHRSSLGLIEPHSSFAMSSLPSLLQQQVQVSSVDAIMNENFQRVPSDKSLRSFSWGKLVPKTSQQVVVRSSKTTESTFADGSCSGQGERIRILEVMVIAKFSRAWRAAKAIKKEFGVPRRTVVDLDVELFRTVVRRDLMSTSFTTIADSSRNPGPSLSSDTEKSCARLAAQREENDVSADQTRALGATARTVSIPASNAVGESGSRRRAVEDLNHNFHLFIGADSKAVSVGKSSKSRAKFRSSESAKSLSVGFGPSKSKTGFVAKDSATSEGGPIRGWQNSNFYCSRCLLQFSSDIISSYLYAQILGAYFRNIQQVSKQWKESQNSALHVEQSEIWIVSQAKRSSPGTPSSRSHHHPC
ncbi:hypothetical protein BDZ89DRAFT_1078081 [Hymenopellis radicata]|nr:hypothetical protein BDZ89DRAFT_1078081 [Hymenopellis radicata]